MQNTASNTAYKNKSIIGAGDANSYYDLYLLSVEKGLDTKFIAALCGIPIRYLTLIFTLAQLREYILLQGVEDGILTAQLALEITGLAADECHDRLESYYMDGRLGAKNYIATQYVLDKRRLSNMQLSAPDYEYRRERNLNTHANVYYTGLSAKNSFIAYNRAVKAHLASFKKAIDTLENDPDFGKLQEICHFPSPPLSSTKPNVDKEAEGGSKSI